MTNESQMAHVNTISNPEDSRISGEPQLVRDLVPGVLETLACLQAQHRVGEARDTLSRIMGPNGNHGSNSDVEAAYRDLLDAESVLQTFPSQDR